MCVYRAVCVMVDHIKRKVKPPVPSCKPMTATGAACVLCQCLPPLLCRLCLVTLKVMRPDLPSLSTMRCARNKKQALAIIHAGAAPAVQRQLHLDP